MNLESIREYCISKKAVTESLPFDNDTLVFKVAGKIFALMSLTGNFGINLKCNPERAIELREQYAEIIPGYHMNKVHWNTVSLEGNLSDKLILELIDHSYENIIQSLSLKIRKENNLE